MRFEIESSFAERLARLIPSAPIRQIFLEAGILSVIERAFEVESGEHAAPDSVLLDNGFGVLLTEPGLFDVPELLVVFAYDQPWRSRRGVLALHRSHRARGSRGLTTA